MKIVTINFEPVPEKEASRVLKQYKEDGALIAFDKRNGITCINPTLDVKCYKNYINCLNMYYNNWLSYGYLDLGLVPVLIAPSFMSDELNESVGTIAKAWPFSIYTMRPTSFLQTSYRGATKDVWIKKEDMAKLINVPIEKASLSTFLKRLEQMEVDSK